MSLGFLRGTRAAVLSPNENMRWQNVPDLIGRLPTRQIHYSIICSARTPFSGVSSHRSKIPEPSLVLFDFGIFQAEWKCFHYYLIRACRLLSLLGCHKKQPKGLENWLTALRNSSAKNARLTFRVSLHWEDTSWVSTNLTGVPSVKLSSRPKEN